MSTTSGPTGSQRWLRRAAVTGLFTALTAIMTWPQPLVMSTHAVSHHDVPFNLWRLRWIAHALATSPQRLFDGNIFYPERNALTLSDALLFEGILAAPLFWLGLPPMLVHNLLLLGALVASAWGMFVLAEHLSGSRAAAVLAAIVFSFAPYRFEHYMHMELQWAMWIPWAFWALQRTIETGAVKYGVLTGIFTSLQVVSCIYYGMFLGLLLPVVAIVQLLALPRHDAVRILRRLAIGAIIAGCTSALYAMPYSRQSARVGAREVPEVTRYSAKPRDYLVATESNLLYAERRGQAERRLFPGVIPPLLALIGLLLVRPRTTMVAYAIGGAAAFEFSLGMHGLVYPILYEHVGALQALRAPARASIYALFCLGVLAAHGYAAIKSTLPSRFHGVLASGLVALLVIEYWVAPLGLVPYPNQPPSLYRWLARQRHGVVAHFPMPKGSNLPGRDPIYAYMSTFHWKPLLNGYSGYYPRSYLTRLDALERFPARPAIDLLRNSHVAYVVVHADGYQPAEFESILQALTESGLRNIGQFDAESGQVTVFRMR